MQPLLLVSEESQILLRILSGSFQTLDVIKDRIVHAFVDLFCSKADLDVIGMRKDNVVQSANREEQGSEDWSSKGNDSNQEGVSAVGFDVLDAMLKHSLDRLKSMRERVSSVKGINNCTLGVNFDKDAYVIRAMCLDGKLGAALSLWCNMIQNSIVPDVITHNYLISGLCKKGELEKAEWIVRAQSLEKEMLSYGLNPDSVTYNLLIGAACNLGLIHLALKLHVEMLRKGCQPDVITYTELLKWCCLQGMMTEADKLLGKLLGSGLAVDHVPFLVRMKRFCRRREFDKVFDLYQKWLVTMPR